MIKLYLAFILFCVSLGYGCHTTPILKNTILKDEAKNYSVFQAASIEFLEFIFETQLCGNMGYIDGVKRRKNSPSELDKYLQSIKKRAKRCKEYEYKMWADIADKARKEQVYFYKWERNYTTGDYNYVRKTGFLTIHNGRIVYLQKVGNYGEGGDFRRTIAPTHKNVSTDILKHISLKDEDKYFSILTPASMGLLKYNVIYEYNDALGIIEEVKQKRNSPTELDKYLKKMSEMRLPYHPLFFPTNKDWIAFKQKAKGGHIYFYKRKIINTKKKEAGFLIVRDDKIVYRYIVGPPPTK